MFTIAEMILKVTQQYRWQIGYDRL